jgi:hypothetical protein
MSPREAYDIYMSVKLHFKSEKYDALKYGFKTANRGQHLAKNHASEQLMFVRLGKKFGRREELIDFMVANAINGDLWVHSLLQQPAMDVYLDWQRRRDSFMYAFKNAMESLAEKNTLDDLLRAPKDGNLPRIIHCWSGDPKNITFEMITILDVLTGFGADYTKTNKDKIFWEDFFLKMRKYRPFLAHIDRRKCKDIIIHAFAKSKPLLQ